MRNRICSGKVTLVWKWMELIPLIESLEPHIWALETFIPRKVVTSSSSSSSSETANTVHMSFRDSVKKQTVSHIFQCDLDDMETEPFCKLNSE